MGDSGGKRTSHGLSGEEGGQEISVPDFWLGPEGWWGRWHSGSEDRKEG